MREHESATSLAPPNNAWHLTTRVGVPACRFRQHHAAADGRMNAASGRDIQTRPDAPREADRDGAMSAAGVIPRAVWTPRA